MSLNDKIADIVKANGANFYGTETIQDGDNKIFRVYITKKDGVSLDLCAEISNELSPFLDVNPPINGAYFLEVSSPGIERKLENPIHFASAINERIKFKIKGGEKQKGILKSSDDNGFVVTIKGEDKSFDYDDVSKVKTYYEWNKK
jgi:ribosome maturation factor RimP